MYSVYAAAHQSISLFGLDQHPSQHHGYAIGPNSTPECRRASFEYGEQDTADDRSTWRRNLPLSTIFIAK